MKKSKIDSFVSKIEGKDIGADSICATCNHVAICAFCERANQPVIFCEEFEATDAPQIRLYGVGETVSGKSVETNNVGICSNCDNIGCCNFSKENEAVFHCEEYV